MVDLRILKRLMKRSYIISLSLKIGLLASGCFITHLGYSASTLHEEDDFGYSLEHFSEHSKRDNRALNDFWNDSEEIPKQESVKNATLRDATLLFSLDYREASAALQPLAQEDVTPQLTPSDSETPPAQPMIEKPQDLPKGLEDLPASAPKIPHPPHIQEVDSSKQPQLTLNGDAPSSQNGGAAENQQDSSNKILINFNNVGIIEYIRFISRISNKNFVFDDADLQFNVTIVSEEPTTIENVMTALIQELRIHDLTLIEQGNNLIIHKNLKVNSVSKVVAEDIPASANDAEIVTQVFRLNTLDPQKAAIVIRPLVSDRALIEPLRETNHLIVTDIVSNVNQISKLLKSIDAPNSGLVIGQYVARTADIETLMPLVQKIMLPISQDQPLNFVSYPGSNSLFIVSTPFLVERSISILQHLDQEKGKTRIIDLRELKFEQGKAGAGVKQGKPEGGKGTQGEPSHPEGYNPGYREEGSGWNFGPNSQEARELREKELLLERQRQAPEGLLPLFVPVEMAAPPCIEEKGRRGPIPLGIGFTEEEEEVPGVEKLRRPLQTNDLYTPVPVDRQKFYIHKLQYRTGDVVLGQLQQIATSLQNTTTNIELLAAINTIQWLQDAKALVITATPENIDKIREIIDQLDIPLRQVFIEMLILQTSLDDSLHYGVNWGSRFGGGNQAGSMGFQEGASTLQGSLDSTGVSDLGGQAPNPTPSLITPFNNALIPDPRNLAKSDGFRLGVMGQHIIHRALGLEFNSIGALISAVHDFGTTNIVMSPKVITEDGVPAQIFVGVNTPFKTQSVSNDLGSIITNNFEFRDVGTSLQVTPHISNGDIISLDILEEYSNLASTPASSGNSNTVIGPTTNKNSTKTSILVPDGYFVILSGMIQDEVDETRSQIPCLGSIPLAGAAFSDTSPVHTKRNLMIFIRPKIIDTDEEIQNITRHQQDVWKTQNKVKPKWQVETETALDYFNVRSTFNTDDEDDLPCREWVH